MIIACGQCLLIITQILSVLSICVAPIVFLCKIFEKDKNKEDEDKDVENMG